MKEELVTLDTAKLAKEKGYDDRANVPYMYTDKDLLRRQCGLMNYPKLMFPFYICAPTQSLLQKWLREVHNINVISLPWKDHGDDVNDEHRYRPMIYNVKTFGEYKTYEEALEKGLQEALKLI